MSESNEEHRTTKDDEVLPDLDPSEADAKNVTGGAGNLSADIKGQTLDAKHKDQ